MKKELEEFCINLAQILNKCQVIREISFECDKTLIGERTDLMHLTDCIARAVSSITVFEVISKEKMQITIIKKTEGQ